MTRRVRWTAGFRLSPVPGALTPPPLTDIFRRMRKLCKSLVVTHVPHDSGTRFRMASFEYRRSGRSMYLTVRQVVDGIPGAHFVITSTYPPPCFLFDASGKLGWHLYVPSVFPVAVGEARRWVS
jgi:hypothetical protein